MALTDYSLRNVLVVVQVCHMVAIMVCSVFVFGVSIPRVLSAVL